MLLQYGCYCSYGLENLTAEAPQAILLCPLFLHLILFVNARHCKHAEFLIVQLLQSTQYIQLLALRQLRTQGNHWTLSVI